MFNIRFFILEIAVVFAGCGGGGTTTTTDTEEVFSEPSQKELLVAINGVRSRKIDCKNGLGEVGPSQPLSWNHELYSSAYEHSHDLAMSNTFSHYGSGTEHDITGYNRGGQSYFTERIEDNGYSEYDTIGENIAGGFSTMEAVIDGWLESPSHCENLMRESFNEMGIAIVVNPDSQYGVYWTQNFGHRDLSE
ncbi:MAG: Transporter [uncultured Sulfurovum sp.]|uniref:Transporter n=1 Tax=uncultured Sulfurovum sp. TaxID=269237 RepID=A0A6S6TAW1_9BACT|nr:MAG: Transporter [uncultured Sulfurovum sp.]